MKSDLKTRYGEWCLVAGAAEGLGEAYSTALARTGMSLILVDIQKDRLISLGHQLETSFGIRVRTVHLDLESADAVSVIMEEINKTGCCLLIYNAAFSRVQKFINNDPVTLDHYINVNIRTPIHLIREFCLWHKEKESLRKGILLMSSLAGSWGTRLLAPYGGSKAFSHILAESLHYELKGEGIDVLACIAGATSTPAYLSSLPPGKENNRATMTPEAVAISAINALGHRAFVVPGFKNQLTYFLLTRILPKSLPVDHESCGWKYVPRELEKDLLF